MAESTDTQSDLARATIPISSYRMMSPGSEAVGLRTNQFKLDNLDDGRVSRVAEEFLISSRLHDWDSEGVLSVMDYFADPMVLTYGQLDKDSQPEGPVQKLPASTPPRMEVGEATLRRRSIRTFTGDQVPASELAAILRSSLAVTGVADVPLSDGSTVEYWYRAAPSGGGLYPVEAYIAVFRVDGLEPGVYRYSPRLDSLITVGDTGMGDAIRASLTVTDDQMSVSGAAAMVVLVGVPWRSMRKYGPRGLRFVFHEAGGIAGYMHLAATALGVGSSDCASYYDDQVNDALGLDGLSRLAIHTILFGTPA